MRISKKSAAKIQGLLKCGMNNGYFTCSPLYIYDTLLNYYYYNGKCAYSLYLYGVQMNLLENFLQCLEVSSIMEIYVMEQVKSVIF